MPNNTEWMSAKMFSHLNLIGVWTGDNSIRESGDDLLERVI